MDSIIEDAYSELDISVALVIVVCVCVFYNITFRL